MKYQFPGQTINLILAGAIFIVDWQKRGIVF